MLSNKNNKKAFSLVEISIVVLIIGLLIAGISKASDMIADSQLKGARSLTKGSKTGRIPGLLLWLETTTTDALKDSERFGGTSISTWSDISPPNLPKIIFRQSGATSTAKYNEGSGGSKLPYISFTAATDYLYPFEPSKTTYGSSDLYLTKSTQAFPSSELTIFAVAQPVANFSLFSFCPNNTGLLTENCTTGTNITLRFGTASSSLIKLEYNGAASGPLLSSTGYKTGDGPFIYSIVSQVGKATIFTNSGNKNTSATGTHPTFLTSYDGSYRIGGGATLGNIYELIVYSSVLSDSNRQKVEDYLASKHKIKLATTRDTF